MRHYRMAYNVMEDSGLLLPVIDVNVNYKKSAKFDDCVAVFTSVASFSPVRLEFQYEARKLSEEEFKHNGGSGSAEPFGELLAKGSTKHMWVNQDWKPVRINKTAPDVYEVVQKFG
jgi:acyl-CoA thioester hydrolase